jgi:hypothetical protein
MGMEVRRDPDLEWLDHVKPTGLVVSPAVIKELQLVPEQQTQADTAELKEHLDLEGDGPALPDPWGFFAAILGWDAAQVAGAPGGPPVPEDLAHLVAEHDTLLRPDWAVRGFEADGPFQLLVQLLPPGTDPDRRGASEGWEATPHQRFERLLRESGLLLGLMLGDRELRLTFAPKGETSGWLAFPLREMATVAGRTMLAGLKLLLGDFRLFNEPADRRLRAICAKSRDAQAAVSTRLAEQVLGALHELLRGMAAAEPELIQDLARNRPQLLYEGLLAVLMRLVFLLYAEDRELLPSAIDQRAKDLYDENYSVRGLYGRLVEDAALNPDTMDERHGGWGRLLALFRLIFHGHRSGFVTARRGKLFDPEVFPFLEGRSDPAEPPRVMRLTDGCLHRILEGLMTIEEPATRTRERLSYRTLDVEQIGSVYEIVMGFTVELAQGRVLAIRAGKHNRTPVFADLDVMAALKPADRTKYLKEACDRGTVGTGVSRGLGSAKTPEDIAAALDSIVDKRGSPKGAPVGAGTPILQPTEERRRTGSHYTPRSLTEPIVRKALEPTLDRLGADATPDAILDLKVCDPAMGSGAFLVEACRQLAAALTRAWERHPGTRPPLAPDEDADLLARRMVAQRCLYGVDKNPMAVDLAQVSLWLATLARDHEFTFLDHALKCGDSLVGLSTEQIEAVHWQPDTNVTITEGIVRHALARIEAERNRIREAADDAGEAELRPLLRRAEQALTRPKAIGDAVIAAFFEGAKPKEREAARIRVLEPIEHNARDWYERVRDLTAGLPVRPFHWPLEFPEVFDRKNGGFDAIVGNPPFLGGTLITQGFGSGYLDFLKEIFPSTGDRADIVASFFQRSFALLRFGGSFGLLACNTIAQGDTRKASLELIVDKQGQIYDAVRRFKWPGQANVVVTSVHVAKGDWTGCRILNGTEVNHITPYLLSVGPDKDPFKLEINQKIAFEGMVPYTDGFIVDEEGVPESERTAVFPYYAGKNVNNLVSRDDFPRIAYFGDAREEEILKSFPHLALIIKERIIADRLTKATLQARTHPWWLYWRTRASLWEKIKSSDTILIRTRVSAHHAIELASGEIIPDTSVIAFPGLGHAAFASLQSRVHEVWARFFASSMKDDLRYTPSDCFETFPFPPDFATDSKLEAAGEACYRFRAELMVARDKGLTKTYNDFHDRRLQADPEIAELRRLHDAMDRAVLRAYGWHDLADTAAPVFLDETNEDEFAYQGRLFWPSTYRDEVLARLLALNKERHEEEVRRGVAKAKK